MGQGTTKPLAFAELPDFSLPNSSTVAVSVTKDESGGSGVSKMRAWIVERPTSSVSAVRACRVDTPLPKGNEVLIAVVCASVSPMDAKRMRLVAQGVAFPAVLGMDVSGTIAAVGPGVNAIPGAPSIGDRVCAHLGLHQKHGAFADFCICDARACSKIPTNVPFAEAAAIPSSGCAAYVALFDKLRVESGRSIFIAGGSGGVGSFAVQLAKYAQLRVIATCSACNAEYVHGLGADLVLEYASDNLIVEQVAAFTGGVGVDYAIDCVSPRNAQQTAQLLRFGGSIVSLAGHVAGDATFFEHQLSTHNVFLPGLHRIEWGLPLLKHLCDGMLALLSNGIVRAPITQVIQFDQLPNALEVVSSGHSRGKVILSMATKAPIGAVQQQTATCSL